MKRILYILLAFTLIITFGCSVVASAEEVEIVEDNGTVDTEESEDTLFSRLYEFFLDNKIEAFTLGGGAVLFVLGLLLKKELSTVFTHLTERIASVITKTDMSAERQKAIVAGLNEMVDAYNEIKAVSEHITNKVAGYAANIDNVIESNAALAAKIEAVSTVLITLMDKEITQNAEVMEVLSSVYTNTKLPQGVKDFVQLKRSENAKLVQEAYEITHPEGGVTTNE